MVFPFNFSQILYLCVPQLGRDLLENHRLFPFPNRSLNNSNGCSFSCICAFYDNEQLHMWSKFRLQTPITVTGLNLQ